MPAPPHELDRAVAADDEVRARALLREHTDEHAEEVLQVLATRGSDGSMLATELLLQQLEETGVIRRFVRSMLLEEAAIDDVCQDVMISVSGSLGSFDGRSHVTTWVHTIVRRRVVDHLRRQRSTVPLEQGDGPAKRISSMIATRLSVQQAVAQLSELYREPVRLRDVEGLSYGEVAQRLDRPVGTVKSQVARGRAMVAASLRERDDHAGVRSVRD